MWRNGSAGYGRDLIDFYNQECSQSQVLQVRNMSYRNPRLPVGGIMHINVDGELELSVEGENLFGNFTIKSVINDSRSQDIPEAEMRVFQEATSEPKKLHLYQIGNYREGKSVSLYSGKPSRGNISWSFHCNLPAKER